MVGLLYFLPFNYLRMDQIRGTNNVRKIKGINAV